MTRPLRMHLSPPPRVVPAALTVRIVLGSLLGQIGWVCVLFGLVFVWVFDPGSALTSAARFAGDRLTTEGVVAGWRETSLSINDEPVYETRYDYRDASGREHSGGSFQTGSHFTTGERVTVEYLEGDPSLSRIQGMRTTAGGLMISFVFLFPLIGLGLAVGGMWKGLKARRLMSAGRLALGRLKAKEATNTRVNNQTVYRLTFEFEAEGGGTFEVVGRTHRPYQLEDEPEERLVYDPRNPADAALLDELPSRPAIDARGDFTLESAGDVALALANLLLPGLAVLAYLGYVVFR